MRQPVVIPEIEDGIPMPDKHAPKGVWTRMALEMKPGQSVLCTRSGKTGGLASLAQAMARLKIKSTTQKQPDGRIRVWRVSE